MSNNLMRLINFTKIDCFIDLKHWKYKVCVYQNIVIHVVLARVIYKNKTHSLF